jgi:hypothetical protein
MIVLFVDIGGIVAHRCFSFHFLICQKIWDDRWWLVLLILWKEVLPMLRKLKVTAGNFEPLWKREVWRFKIWFNLPFLLKCLYQVRVITILTVFRLLTDFVCLYTYDFLKCHDWLPIFLLFKFRSIHFIDSRRYDFIENDFHWQYFTYFVPVLLYILL